MVTTNYQTIFNDVEAELDYAHKKWGTEFDSKNNLNDWAAYTNIYLSRALEMRADKATQRKNLIKAIGLLVSAVEWLDSGNIAPRHYDAEIEKYRVVNAQSGGY
jgi:hypothetical protein